MKKLAISMAIASAFSINVYANYEAEVGLTYSDIEERDAITAYGALFFDAVDTSKGPHAEASFLDKASGVKLQYSDVEDADDNPFSISGRFVTAADLIIEAQYDDLGSTENISFGVGTYITGTSDIVVSYISNDDNDTDILNGEYHRVDSLGGGSSLAYTAGGSYVDADNDNGYGINGDVTYYVDNFFGFGASASIISVDSNDVTTIGLHGSYFFTPDFYLKAAYDSIDTDGAIEDIDSFSLGAFLRF